MVYSHNTDKCIQYIRHANCLMISVANLLFVCMYISISSGAGVRVLVKCASSEISGMNSIFNVLN